ncbi:MAG: NINE protein [Saprospiraceae bacterium]|nr:NINE protein [Candidatus Opimibacter iunctus]
MRNKTAAALFAFFLGWAGVHRFYLGQVGLGILYVFLTIISLGIITGILGLIDAIILFTMKDEDFDRKYNAQQGMVPPIYNQRNQQGYPPIAQPRQRGRMPATPRNMSVPSRDIQNPYKVNGIKKYKEFDLEGAIEDFKKGLEINAKDISLHFNLACAYSLTEQVDKAYMHIDRAVSLGFNDFEKLKTHDDLAFVRIQDRFDEFQKNGYRLQLPAVETDNTQVPEIPKEEDIQDDLLLAQLKRLAELRDRGLLSEQEFAIEKRKLTR